MAQSAVPATDEADAAGHEDTTPQVTATKTARPTSEDTRAVAVVSALGHELLTPLTAIQGVLDLVLAGIAGDVPPALRSLLEAMHGNGRRLERTIASILDIERIEAGSGTLNRSAVFAKDVALRAVSSCEDDANLAGVILQSVVLSPTVQVWGDEARLRDAIGHVVANAVKFSPTGATVAVCVTEHDGMARIVVEDQGPGIPEDARESIFRKFVQLGGSNEREADGLGLGLAITKSIVEKHHGSVDFESAQRGGTTFFIDLPKWDRSDS
jgi:signal transduction histidine kinase